MQIDPMTRQARRQLLTSPQLQRELQRTAARIAQAAGEGFATDSRVGRNRARATAHTATPSAWYRQVRYHLLNRALSSARRT